MKTGVLRLIALFCAAAPAAVAQAQELKYAFVYDVGNDRGPCPISREQFDRLVGGEAVDAVMPPGKWCAPGTRAAFRDSTGVSVVVVNRRFRSTHQVVLVAEVSRGSGVAEVRGLNDVSPLNLGTLGTPITHGGRPPSTVTIAAVTTAQVFLQLLDDTQMNQPALTLRGQAEDLKAARRALEQDRTELQREMTRLRLGSPDVTVPKVDCAAISGAPSIEGLKSCVDRLMGRIQANTSLEKQMRGDPQKRRVVPATCGTNAETEVAHGWSDVEFDCVVDQIDRRIADLSVVRARLDEYAFRAAADKVQTESEQLIARYNQFRQNLDAVEAAIADLRELQQLAGKAITAQRRAEIKRQLKERYTTNLDEAELNQLADSRRVPDASVAAAARQLKRVVDEVRKDLDDSAVRDSAEELRNQAQAFGVQVDALNLAFAHIFQAINDVYFQWTDQSPRRVPIDLSAHAGENRDVFCELRSIEQFKPYRFGFVPPAPTASPLPVVTTTAPNPNLTVTPANLPLNVSKPFDFEMHKLWRANLVSGVVFSSVRKMAYGTRVLPGTQDVVATVVDDQRPTPHYLLGLNVYLRERDTYPRKHRTAAEQWTPGILGGIGLENSKQFFIGPNFEPTLGIDFSFGLHWGEQTALALSTEADKTVLATGASAPTRTVMKPGWYLLIGFDLNIFRRVLGAAAPSS